MGDVYPPYDTSSLHFIDQIEDTAGIGKEETNTIGFHVLLHIVQLHHIARYQGRIDGNR